MVNGIVIPAAAQPLERRTFSALGDYQQAVGGWIEAVDLPVIGASLYVNEEGLLRQLPFNSRATFLWWYRVPEARQHAMLVGDAVLIGIPDRNGDSTDLPAAVVETLTGRNRWRVEVRTVGDPKWYRSRMTYDDYFEALVWAMLTLERWTAAEDVRVVPVLLDDDSGQAVSPLPAA